MRVCMHLEIGLQIVLKWKADYTFRAQKLE